MYEERRGDWEMVEGRKGEEEVERGEGADYKGSGADERWNTWGKLRCSSQRTKQEGGASSAALVI